jgi:hypothetical protein
MAFANPNISDIIATTIQSRTGKIADNVTKNNALLTRLNQRGNVKTFSGGNVILQELSFQQNANGGWYSGYETLPVAQSDVISAAQYNIKQAACPVTISGLEEIQNSGKERIIDLLESRVGVAESTMANIVAQSLYSDGTGSSGKEIDGLNAQVPVDPTTGTVGGIDRGTWNFWRSKILKTTTSGGAATSANIQAYMNTLWASLVRGNDRPDLIVMDNGYWGLYMGSLQSMQRFTDANDAKLGFVSIKYMDADVILDGGIGGFDPTKTMFMLNSKYIFFRPYAGRNFVPLNPDKRYSVNQDASVQILAWAGNLTASGLQFQGRMFE